MARAGSAPAQHCALSQNLRRGKRSSMSMLTITLKDKSLIGVLKRRAEANGKTVDQEAREALAQSLDRDKPAVQLSRAERDARMRKAFAMARRLAKKTGVVKGAVAAKELRKLRSRPRVQLKKA
jgi:plasmid stability protein